MTPVPKIVRISGTIRDRGHVYTARDTYHSHAGLWLAVAVAAAVRAAFAWSYMAAMAAETHQALRVLPFAYESGNVAASLATGHGFASPLGVASGPTAWVAPVYATLLAGLFHLFGVKSFGSFIAATALNIIFASLVCLPLYAAMRLLASEFTDPRGAHRAALLACWLWVIFPNAILLTYESMWNGCLSALLGMTLLWASLRIMRDQPAIRHWLLYGVLWGVVLLTNPIFAAVLPFVVALLAWRAARRRGIALALGVAMLCVLPWTVRNRSALHAWVPVRSDLGLALWLGNNPGASVPWHGQQHPLDDLDERAQFVQQGEMRYMHAKFAAAAAYIAAHPARTARRAAQRFVVFWSGGALHPVRVFLAGRAGSLATWRNRYVLAMDLLLALAALAGILMLLRRRSRFVWLAAVFPLLIPIAYYLTEAIPRYRLAIDPEVILLAAIWLAGVFSCRRLRAA